MGSTSNGKKQGEKGGGGGGGEDVLTGNYKFPGSLWYGYQKHERTRNVEPTRASQPGRRWALSTRAYLPTAQRQRPRVAVEEPPISRRRRSCLTSRRRFSFWMGQLVGKSLPGTTAFGQPRYACVSGRHGRWKKEGNLRGRTDAATAGERAVNSRGFIRAVPAEGGSERS